MLFKVIFSSFLFVVCYINIFTFLSISFIWEQFAGFEIYHFYFINYWNILCLFSFYTFSHFYVVLLYEVLLLQWTCCCFLDFYLCKFRVNFYFCQFGLFVTTVVHCFFSFSTETGYNSAEFLHQPMPFAQQSCLSLPHRNPHYSLSFITQEAGFQNIIKKTVLNIFLEYLLFFSEYNILLGLKVVIIKATRILKNLNIIKWTRYQSQFQLWDEWNETMKWEGMTLPLTLSFDMRVARCRHYSE